MVFSFPVKWQINIQSDSDRLLRTQANSQMNNRWVLFKWHHPSAPCEHVSVPASSPLRLSVWKQKQERHKTQPPTGWQGVFSHISWHFFLHTALSGRNHQHFLMKILQKCFFAVPSSLMIHMNKMWYCLNWKLKNLISNQIQMLCSIYFTISEIIISSYNFIYSKIKINF